MPGTGPDFVIVGSPRSGTTLVQRLASEIPGVAVPPETHFFSEFYRGLVRRRSFPLNTSDLRDELRLYLAMKTSVGLNLDIDRVVAFLGGSCSGPGDLYGAVTRILAGTAAVVGEKTPDHLRWWRPLSASYPRLRVIAVTRDPRGVVASTVTAGWGAGVPELLASRWRLDQQELARAAKALGRDRYLRIRYEDAVIDPVGTRNAVAQWLGVGHDPGHSPDVTADQIFLPWEHWKQRAAEPITTDRISAWVTVIDPKSAANILRLCEKEMRSLGYWGIAEQSALNARGNSAISMDLRVRIARMTNSRLRERLWIRTQSLTT